jgi:hypothetical protein
LRLTFGRDEEQRACGRGFQPLVIPARKHIGRATKTNALDAEYETCGIRPIEETIFHEAVVNL